MERDEEVKLTKREEMQYVHERVVKVEGYLM
jgi:hypothetical protein